MLRVSEEFYDLINHFEGNNIVSEIKKLNFSEIESDYNYITISDSNKFINFFPNSKVEEYLKNKSEYVVKSVKNLTHSEKNDHIFKALGYNKDLEFYWYPERGHRGIIKGETISEKTGKTYVLFKSLENDRLCVINKIALEAEEPDLFIESKNKLKIGRFIKHLFEKNNINFKDSEIEKFVNLYKSTFDVINDKFSYFEIVDGEYIKKWYKSENYETENGTLGSSCMANVDSNYFDIYSYSKNCKMLILKSKNYSFLKDGEIVSEKICGRALIWDSKLVEKEKETKIKLMDRVYTNEDSDIELFKAYAKENGWWYKKEQNYYADTEITNGEKVVGFYNHENRVEVDIERIKFEKYPFIDTFCYLHSEKKLSNNYYIEEKKNSSNGFRSTEGSYETYKGVYNIKLILK